MMKKAKRLMDRAKVSALRIDFNGSRWEISGRCVCNDHPTEGWRSGSYYHLGSGPSLDEAEQNALASQDPRR